MLIVVNHLLIRKRRLSLRIPIDHTQTAVYQALTIQVAEHFDNRCRTFLVHRKRRTVPIARATECPQLLQDDASVLIGPSPSMLQKLFPRQVALVDTLLLETLNHFRLRCNRRMVSSGHPASVLTFQTRTAHQHILYRLIQHVSHMQHARHIWRRYNYRIRLTILLGSGASPVLLSAFRFSAFRFSVTRSL